MKTRSVSSSREYSLSVNLYGGGGSSPSPFINTRRGPKTPRCSQTEEEPGPPLNENVRGRLDESLTPSFVYATKKICARGFSPSASFSRSAVSSFNTIVPAVTLYLITLPLILTECLDTTRLSTAFTSFFSSF